MSVLVRRVTLPETGSASNTYPLERSTNRKRPFPPLPINPRPATGLPWTCHSCGGRGAVTGSVLACEWRVEVPLCPNNEAASGGSDTPVPLPKIERHTREKNPVPAAEEKVCDVGDTYASVAEPVPPGPAGDKEPLFEPPIPPYVLPVPPAEVPAPEPALPTGAADPKPRAESCAAVRFVCVGRKPYQPVSPPRMRTIMPASVYWIMTRLFICYWPKLTSWNWSCGTAPVERFIFQAFFTSVYRFVAWVNTRSKRARPVELLALMVISLGFEGLCAIGVSFTRQANRSALSLMFRACAKYGTAANVASDSCKKTEAGSARSYRIPNKGWSTYNARTGTTDDIETERSFARSSSSVRTSTVIVSVPNRCGEGMRTLDCPRPET